MITKMGYLFMFDIHSGKALYRAKISEQTIFVTTTHVRVPSCTLVPHVDTLDTIRAPLCATDRSSLSDFALPASRSLC